ncbi:MAG TPA: N-acetylmuramoyl-L-alanine amidase [Terriglobia bacterium]|nr:N-acetylmuramoyl-L-alanine amidase [Terriglobia bacterium]
MQTRCEAQARQRAASRLGAAIDKMKIHAVVIAALLSVATLAAQTPAHHSASLLQQAREAFVSAEALEAELNEKPPAERTRALYLKVIKAYQRVYVITPHTGYADNALMTMARLYEEIQEKTPAMQTLSFLIREYPGTPFKETAEKDLARLQGVPERKAGAVENVRFWETQNSVRVVIDVTGEIAFKQGEAKSPDRVFIDISPARLNSLLAGKQWPVKSDLLGQIRIGQYDGSTVRVVLDVGRVGQTTSFMLKDPDRLVVDIMAKEEIPAAGSPQPVAAAVTAPPVDPPQPLLTVNAPTRTAPKPADTKPPDAETKVITAAKPPNAGTRSLIRSLGLKLSRVVIDAGHGGHDTGSIGPKGYSEKELVLDVAARLKQLIETELGAEVVMTRNDDSFVPLETRTVVANQQQSDLFISIHANSSAVRAVRGVETFFLNFTSSREALETASRENAASERSIHELQDLVKKIMLRDKVDESRELARHIQHAMAARKGSGTDRGVKQAPFVVLIGANMPSILAEVCFISNPEEEKLIRTPQYRQAIADALFEGVRSYAESLSGTKTAKTQEKNQE